MIGSFGIFSLSIIVAFIKDIRFVEGKTTNYSLGISVYACFVSVVLFYEF